MRGVLASLAFVSFAPPRAQAAGVHAVFDLSTPDQGPFPSDRFTVRDGDQLTGRRVVMPLPDCAIAPSDCLELETINTLDGFNPQPQLTVRFDGAVDPATVTSASMFLVRLGDVAREGDHRGRHREQREVIGINQVVWDPPSNTLHAQSDAFLHQHTRYLLVVTSGVRDTGGDAVEAGDFRRFMHEEGRGRDRASKEYRDELHEALEALEDLGVRNREVVAASVFTTRSLTVVLEKIREQVKAAAPAPARFDILIDSNRPAVFALDDIAVNGMTVARQVSADRGAPLASAVPIVLLETVRNDIPGAIRTIAFGKYTSPSYENQGRFIPAVPTRTGAPAVQGIAEVYFDLFIPAGMKPKNGWPVAIFGHGLGASKEEGLFSVAPRLAAHGIASIGINALGHGQGEGGRLLVKTNEGLFTLPSGGRGVDKDNDPKGTIDDGEGVGARPPRGLIISSSDGLRQTAIDTMQLIRVIQVGVDVDGDGVADLDPSRISYVGQSMGAMIGAIFLAVEPEVLAGDLNVAGGPNIDILRLTNLRSTILGPLIASRQPSLRNAPLGAPLFGFDENLPLRNLAPRINAVPGAMALQDVLDRCRWVQTAGDPAAYARHLREEPLEGMPVKDVILQFAKGDKTMPNPLTTALVRAGNLADRTTYYRYDLVFPRLVETGEMKVPPLNAGELNRAKDPHSFMPNRTNPPPLKAPRSAAITFGFRDLAQEQVAVLFESKGEINIDPDGDGPIFETPIAGPLPEELNQIP